MKEQNTFIACILVRGIEQKFSAYVNIRKEVSMPLYKVTIQRSFDVEIQADNQRMASQLTEWFLGYGDESGEQDRIKNNFSIQSIEMLENNVIEIVKTTSDEVS